MKLSWANRITILRIFLIVPFVSFMLKINDPDLSPALQVAMRYGAIIVYLIMAVSDGVDGYLARTRKQVTRLGAFLDPVADKLLITSACLLLASQRSAVEGFLLPPTVVVLIIGKDLFLLIGFVILYLITSQVRIHTVWIGKVATALQLSMVAAILIAPEVSLLIGGWIWFLLVLWWSAAGAAILAMLIYIRNGSRYIEEYERDISKKPDAERSASVRASQGGGSNGGQSA
jgi:CDP-diacylglycerol--glycerol-3-phosphate 3-phosphatidyltransferase